MDDMSSLMDAFEGLDESDHAGMISTFASILQTDPGTASFFLESADWDVQVALGTYLDAQSGGGQQLLVPAAPPEGARPAPSPAPAPAPARPAPRPGRRARRAPSVLLWRQRTRRSNNTDECHRSPRAAHFHQELSMYLAQLAQTEFQPGQPIQFPCRFQVRW